MPPLSDHLPFCILFSLMQKSAEWLAFLLRCSDLPPTTSPPLQNRGETDVHIQVYEPLGCTVKHISVWNPCFCQQGALPPLHHPYGYINNTFFLTEIQYFVHNKTFFYKYIKNVNLFCAKGQVNFAIISRNCEQIMNTPKKYKN